LIIDQDARALSEQENKVCVKLYEQGAKIKAHFGRGKRSVLQLHRRWQPDVFRDYPALLLRDDLNPLHHAKGLLWLTETELGVPPGILYLLGICGYTTGQG